MKITVLAGGLSPERDVSLSSGRKIAAALRRRGHRVCFIDLFLGMRSLPADIDSLFTTGEDATAATIEVTAPNIQAVIASRGAGFSDRIGYGVIEVCRAADITFLALHGGDGENGKLQAFFDMMGIRYTGNGSLGSACAMHKWVSKQMFLSAGIPTPRGILVHPSDDATFPLPCVVKPCCGGSSIGISIARTEEEYAAALAEAFAYEDEVLVEEYIEGKELTCGVLGGEALPITEIIPRDGFYDYAHKYQAGWTEEITPARISPADTQNIQACAVKALKALFLPVYGRVDFLLMPDGRFYCLEVNTLPGMTPTSLLPQEAAAAGIDYETLCERVVTLSERN